MKPTDRARLTTALRDHVGKIAADLRAKMRAPGDTRTRAQQLHSDEQVAEDFDVWTDLLSRRAAVLWVLKSVYVRVLEDRGLLTPGRLLDQEAQQLFERLAPHLGETAFLRWMYRDLASSHGGLPELFSPQPAEVALPSDELSRSLITFWRHRDADTGATWSFAEERFEGELMGDLYQELDPVVKDRFALCQTPDFVRAFILDRTLTPAIETFGAEEVRLLDPACGSGHFLIDGFKRLVAATEEKHPDWERGKVVAHALDRVVGVDLNDYACALARTRLIMTAAELAGVTKLADAARFHPHVYWADGLEQVEREEQKTSLQYALFEKIEEKPRATLTRSDVRAALKKVFSSKFHAVVANPPYILERDDARKAYHRDLISKKRRYVTAAGKYSLAAPFTERCFQLAVTDGFVGLITSNNFMKREFGKPLIEQVLATVDLNLVVDASQAYIPFHDTPTVLLFGRNRPPASDSIRAVMSKRGEMGTPSEPARGRVWLSILEAWGTVGFENEFVSVECVPRPVLSVHPWSLQGGGASQLKERIEASGKIRLKDVVDSIGVVAITGQDDVFLGDARDLRRAGIPESEIRCLVLGDEVRDWGIEARTWAIFPYDAALKPHASDPAIRRLRPFACLLAEGVVFGQTRKERGLKWFEYAMVMGPKLRTPLTIAFSFVSTHNHFVLDRDGKLFNRSAPVIKLPQEATEAAHLSLLGILNSSVACFWMKQVFYPKGSKTHDVDKEGTLPENNRYEFAATGMQPFPLPALWDSAGVNSLAGELDGLARLRQDLAPAAICRQDDALASPTALRAAFAHAETRDVAVRRRMVFLQEELDWAVYRLFGLSEEAPVQAEADIGPDDRPFCWSTSHPPDSVPDRLRDVYSRRRLSLDRSRVLKLLETPVYKRLWRGVQGVFGRYDRTYEEKTRTALRTWLLDRVEAATRAKGRPVTVEQLTAALQDDPAVLAVCEVLTSKRDFALAELVHASLIGAAVPCHRFHTYSATGLVKLSAWERAQHDAEEAPDGGRKGGAPPPYSVGDFLDPRIWQLRGKLDVPSERFVAFTEVPGRSGVEVLYGWAGFHSLRRLKAILALDEELEDSGIPLADRIGLLDSAWRLLPDVAREDSAAATRLKAELQALVGPEGPSRELIDDWKKRFPPPSARAGGARKASTTELEDDDSLEDLPSVIPNVSEEEHAAILIWALLHTSGGTATRMDLARAFALRARPLLLKRLAPSSLKREVAHWVSTVGSRSVKAGLLASTLSELAGRNGVSLGTNREGRATVITGTQTPAEAQIDAWFLFEADLALKVLRAQPEEKFSAIDKALTGTDRKLLEAAA